MPKPVWSITLLPVLLLSGCVDTDHLLLTQSPPARITAKGPIVILDAAPTRPFIKLAMVQAVETAQGYATYETLRRELLTRAADLDADAVMDLTVGSDTSGAMIGTPQMGLMGSVGSVKQLRAIAIRYIAQP